MRGEEKIKCRWFLVLIGAVFAFPWAHASQEKVASYSHEVLLNPTAFTVPTSSGTGGGALFNAGTFASIGVGYEYLYSSFLSINANAAFLTSKAAGATTTAVTVVVGPTFNFPLSGSDIQDAFFVSGAVGLTHTSGTLVTSRANTTVRGEVGKRFKIFERLVWRPSVGLLYVDHMAMNPAFVVNALGASVFF